MKPMVLQRTRMVGEVVELDYPREFENRLETQQFCCWVLGPG